MFRYFIMVGDPTTSGGTVVSGDPTFIFMGRARAYENDAIACPACQSSGVIKCVGTRIPHKHNGKEAALDGDLCLCRCNPPPRLKATQSNFRTEGDAYAVSTTAAGLGSAGAEFNHNQFFDNDNATSDQEDAQKIAPYDLFFLVQSDITSEPVANTRYKIKLDTGEEFFGTTDENGYTQKVYSNSPINAHIEVYYDDTHSTAHASIESDTCCC